ncbi:ORF 50 [Macacine gammaherpesvirus 5]|uniref:Transactivator n=2 Tax=Macacine gammaherpesvirus 5 TaxID=154334 RepID=Q9J2J9_9GAMA|nr:transactivator [Rhesus monkey rhadinovirus H26-95]QFN51647.1 ORF 50 [Macacine gammaherpesvirus 5]QFN51743.1 ORF 50 [Macacine gammaherpesvirus 5]QFN51834.1 ORF 50 [Macacine gammaherpesvirus 5]
MECASLGPISGLIADLNLFNLFCLYRGSRVKTRGAATCNVPCAECAQGIVRILTERALCCTEKMFIASACSGVVIPPQLARVLHDVYAEMKAKCLGAWRRLICCRRPIMAIADSVLVTYNTLDAEGKLDLRLKALCKLVFQPIFLQRILAPMQLLANGKMVPDNYFTITGTAEKRRPVVTGSTSGMTCPGSSLVPDSLILPVCEPGLLPAPLVDLSNVLENPEIILSAPPLSQFVITNTHPSLPQSVSIITPTQGVVPGQCFMDTWKAVSQSIHHQAQTPILAAALTGSTSAAPGPHIACSPVAGTSRQVEGSAGVDCGKPACVPQPALPPNVPAKRMETVAQLGNAPVKNVHIGGRVYAPLVNIPIIDLTSPSGSGQSPADIANTPESRMAAGSPPFAETAATVPAKRKQPREDVADKRLKGDVRGAATVNHPFPGPSGMRVREQGLFDLIESSTDVTANASGPKNDDDMLAAILQDLYGLQSPPAIDSPSSNSDNEEIFPEVSPPSSGHGSP